MIKLKKKWFCLNKHKITQTKKVCFLLSVFFGRLHLAQKTSQILFSSLHFPENEKLKQEYAVFLFCRKFINTPFVIFFSRAKNGTWKMSNVWRIRKTLCFKTNGILLIIKFSVFTRMFFNSLFSRLALPGQITNYFINFFTYTLSAI